MKINNQTTIRRVLLTSILTFQIVFLGNALDTKPSDEFAFGFKIGGNYANVWDEKGQDFRADGRWGFAGGAFMGIPIGKYLGIQPEMHFSQKGFKGSGILLGTSYSMNRTTSHLDIPIQFQIKPSKNLTLLLGPQFSYLMHQKDVYTFGLNRYLQEEEFRNDNVRKNILGFVVGADINIEEFVISGRVGWDFQNNHGDGTSSTPRYKNQWLQFTLGYRM